MSEGQAPSLTAILDAEFAEKDAAQKAIKGKRGRKSKAEIEARKAA